MTTQARRRWFRCSLRALFVVLTIVCVGFGWLVRQMQIVQERKAVLQAIDDMSPSLGTNLWIEKRQYYDDSTEFYPKDCPEYVRVSWIREYMGDEPCIHISIMGSFEPRLVERLENAFPEAELNIAASPYSGYTEYRDSLFAPAADRKPNKGGSFKTGLIEK